MIIILLIVRPLATSQVYCMLPALTTSVMAYRFAVHDNMREHLTMVILIKPIYFADNHDIISVRVYDVDDNPDEPDFEVIIDTHTCF